MKEWRKMGFHLAFGATMGIFVGQVVTNLVAGLADDLAKKLIESDKAEAPEVNEK